MPGRQVLGQLPIQPVELRAVITASDEAVITVDAQLVWDGKPRAEASTLWKRWRPRT